SIGYEGALIRYNSDGSPDDSFGEEGRIILDFGNMGDEYVFVSMALQQDNKIVVAGFSYVSDYDFTVLRYNENGTLDSLFGEDGKAVADIMDSSDDRATSVVIQPDGKVIVAGWSGVFGVEGSGWDFGLARFNTDGTLDYSFGNEGTVLSDLCNFWDDRPESVAIQSDGKILVAGCSYTVGYSDFALARYNTDGTLDTTFNSSGIIITDIGNSTYDNGIAMAVQDDGKIIIAGISGDNIAIARYLSDLNISNVDFSSAPDNLLIYPVPVSNEAILKYYLDRNEIISITLYDNTGKKIQSFINREKRQRGQNSEILVFSSSLSPGYYILELSTTNKKAGVKIIKQ
ncbi:MAG: T9SS type A sorting domain-containing protein, partial [Bacteroidales bacterium]